MDQEPLRFSRYHRSQPIDGLIPSDDPYARRLHAAVVDALRTATTGTLNDFIEETRHGTTPDDPINVDAYYAGLVEGFLESRRSITTSQRS